MFEDFPSLVTIQVLPRVTDPSPAKQMICHLLSSIRTSGKLMTHSGDLSLLAEVLQVLHREELVSHCCTSSHLLSPAIGREVAGFTMTRAS